MTVDMSSASEEIAGVVIADATVQGYPLTYVSPGFEQLTGYGAADMLGRSCGLLAGPETDPGATAVLREALAAGREAYVTLLNYRADGSTFWNEVALAPQRDASGRLVQYLGVQKDVTERRAADARIHELAYFDTLTRLANRAALHSELQRALRDARAGETELALLFVDLDDFKRVNDAYGHLAGDALLRAVADRLRAVVRSQDLLARPGGDEFTLLIRGVARDVAGLATDLAARVNAALREPFDVDGMPLEVRASVGVSTFPRDATTAEDLLRHADAAMYVAKGGGKDRFHVYRSRSAATGREGGDDGFAPQAAVGELERILAEHDLTAVFQPIVEIVSGTVVAYEALTRGPQGSVLQRPDRLFATAAVAGRVDELDWLCRATAAGAALDARLGKSASLFINCEPSTIGSACPDAHRDVWERAQRELDLVLEITERAVTDRPADLVRVIGEHRGAGRGIALDDVGADDRSLALLPLLEPDVIKLDLRLVQDRPSTDQAAIVSAVAVERERTGAQILAEGIENEQHLAVARSLGATLGQGWHWGRPGPLSPAPGSHPLHRRASCGGRVGATPFEVVTAERPTASATKALLLPISHHLEHRALRIGEGAVILSAFQEAKHFTPKTLRRYETLVRGASLVAAFGVGLGDEPVAGVRGAHIEADDALAGEWSVVVLGPHFAGALVAKDLGDTGPDRERRFEFATVYDRGLVVAAAQTLLARIAPTRPS
jgi:diguanylate cyclase (GGDEF)-like protein/PAS domain S-box-containing protein